MAPPLKAFLANERTYLVSAMFTVEELKLELRAAEET